MLTANANVLHEPVAAINELDTSVHIDSMDLQAEDIKQRRLHALDQLANLLTEEEWQRFDKALRDAKKR